MEIVDKVYVIGMRNTELRSVIINLY
jgi:hypothetical protein